MRVGIDIRKFYDYGIGTYIQNLITAFDRRRDHSGVYFASDEISATMPELKNGEIVVNNSKKYSIRELFSLSIDAQNASLDLFHAPHYTLPLKLGIPSVVTIHDIIHLRMKNYYSMAQRLYAGLMVRHACSTSSAVIVDSTHVKEELLQLVRIPEEKIHIIPLGVNDSFFSRSSIDTIGTLKTAYKISKPYFLYTGSLKPHKNIPVLLKAFQRLIQNNDAELVFTGEKVADNGYLQAMINQYQLNPHIIDLGRVPQQELPALYQGAVAVVLPSLYEGFGFSMLEAMASGVTAIGARSTSIPEVIGDAGLLFTPDDDIDLFEKMELALSDSNSVIELKTKGVERARKFSWDTCAEETYRVYQKVIS